MGNSAMFGSIFRQNAARALLLPRQRPNQRTPLWLQRLKAADLLQVARKYDSFPMIIETYRECLRDVLDLVHLRELLERIEAGEMRVEQVDTASPSPFAAAMLFTYIMAFMYAGDAPRAERKSAMLTLNRDLLEDVLGAQTLRELIEPAAVEQLEGRLQRTLLGWKADSADDLADVFLRLVDLTEPEVRRRFDGDPTAALAELIDGGQIVRIVVPHSGVPHPVSVVPGPASRVPRPSGTPSSSVGAAPLDPEMASETRLVPAEYATWLRHALDEADHRPTTGDDRTWDNATRDAGRGTRDERPRLDLVRRYAANHGPFEATAVARRYGFDPTVELEALAAQRVVARGAFMPGKAGEEWCLVENLRQLHRHSLSILREQIEPREPEQFAAFLAAWQGLSSHPELSGVAGLRRLIAQLQGVALPMEIWEPDVLVRRLANYQTAWLDQLCASGEVLWAGSTSAGGGKGKIAFYFRDELDLLLPAERLPRELSAGARRARDWLETRGASFLQDVSAGAGLALPQAYDAVWELVWAGEATNDTFDPVRSPRRPGTQSPAAAHPDSNLSREPGLAAPARPRHWSYRRDFKRPGAGLPASQGRWSLLPPAQPAPLEERVAACARQLLARYGVVAREMAVAEDGPVPWAPVYRELKRLEAIGQVRRGYFVKGLSGAQFALPEAVELLRQPRQERLLVNAADPANPWGLLLPYPGERRVTRLAGNALVLDSGRPLLAIEGQGRDLTPLDGDGLESLDLLPRLLDAPARLRRLKRVEVERWAGQAILASPARRPLEAAGFEAEPQRLVLRPSRL
ncbi:MAG: Lhr family helicase [Chloroflexota bacterium]